MRPPLSGFSCLDGWSPSKTNTLNRRGTRTVMANTAHFISAKAGRAAVITVRDDRGSPITEIELPESPSSPGETDETLRNAGWTRSSDWSTADDGWVVPVVPS